MSLDRDGFIKQQPVVFTDSLDRIAFTIENRSLDQHEATLTLTGLPEGGYELKLDHTSLLHFFSKGDEHELKIPVSSGNASVVTITRD